MRKYFVILFWLSVVFAVTMAILPQSPHLPGMPSDKLQHIMAFTVMTGLACLAYPDLPKLRLLGLMIALGAGIELAQAIPALHRDSELLDLVADSAASAVTLPVTHWLRARLAFLR